MRERIVKAARATIDFLGPVAGAIQGELSKQETGRAIVKAGIVFIATQTSVAATVHDPDFQTNVLIPLGAAVLTGAMDAAGRLKQGEIRPSPEPPPVLPPIPPPPPDAKPPEPPPLKP